MPVVSGRDPVDEPVVVLDGKTKVEERSETPIVIKKNLLMSFLLSKSQFWLRIFALQPKL